MGLNKHLDGNEKMIYFFRPSRKAFIHQYIFFICLLATCGYLAMIFKEEYFKIVLGIAALFPTYGLLKDELTILSSRYALTNERLFYSHGIFTEDFRSFHYYSITDIALKQTFWDKMVNTGTLSINTGGTDTFEIRFLKISNPVAVKRKINDLTPQKIHMGTVGTIKPRHIR